MTLKSGHVNVSWSNVALRSGHNSEVRARDFDVGARECSIGVRDHAVGASYVRSGERE